jgi:hypothetical protein
VQRLSGHVHSAADSHRQALALAEEIQSRWDAGHAHWGLGRCASACGNLAVARQHLSRAQQIFGELGTPEADEVETELAHRHDRASVPLLTTTPIGAQINQICVPRSATLGGINLRQIRRAGAH